MRFTEAHHRQVVATTTATKLGRVDGFVIEPGPVRVSALRVGGALLSWEDLKAFGQDAVTVEDDSGLRPPRDAEETRRAHSDLDVIGKLALTEAGESVGSVTDVEFDPATGAVRAVITTLAEIPGDTLIGLGSYAAVFAVAD